MFEKGFLRKDLWLSKESLEIIAKYKTKHNLKSNDEAINQLLEALN